MKTAVAENTDILKYSPTPHPIKSVWDSIQSNNTAQNLQTFGTFGSTGIDQYVRKYKREEFDILSFSTCKAQVKMCKNQQCLVCSAEGWSINLLLGETWCAINTISFACIKGGSNIQLLQHIMRFNLTHNGKYC